MSLNRLESSRHRLISARGRAVAARQGVSAFFERWMSLRPDERLAVALDLAGGHRGAMQQRLGHILTGGPRDEKLAAIALSRSLAMTAALETRLVGSLADPDTHVVAAAVSALADKGSRHGVGAARRALGHADPRVQANAVETLSRIDRDPTDVLDDLLTSRDNRIRANAVQGVLRHRGVPSPGTGLGSGPADEAAKEKFPDGWESPKPYIRIVPQPQ